MRAKIKSGNGTVNELVVVIINITFGIKKLARKIFYLALCGVTMVSGSIVHYMSVKFRHTHLCVCVQYIQLLLVDDGNLLCGSGRAD